MRAQALALSAVTMNEGPFDQRSDVERSHAWQTSSPPTSHEDHSMRVPSSEANGGKRQSIGVFRLGSHDRSEGRACNESETR